MTLRGRWPQNLTATTEIAEFACSAAFAAACPIPGMGGFSLVAPEHALAAHRSRRLWAQPAHSSDTREDREGELVVEPHGTPETSGSAAGFRQRQAQPHRLQIRTVALCAEAITVSASSLHSGHTFRKENLPVCITLSSQSPSHHVMTCKAQKRLQPAPPAEYARECAHHSITVLPDQARRNRLNRNIF